MDNNSYDKLINRIIDKRYKIENVVGVGGMAYVLKAKDLTTDRDVAVKILSDEYRDDERAVKRFINESKTVAMLDHENIVKILDVVLHDEMKYIVMEFIDGITL
ncbi:MAG: protein kinase, partial [Eubacteriales bacterium]